MKDATQKQLESSRPDESFVATNRHCLRQLFRDRRHSIRDEVVKGLTYEELIGSLLQVQDLVSTIAKEQSQGRARNIK